MSLPPLTDDYVGEPQYPAPWTTKKPREGLRDTDEAKIVYLSPDVCRTPVGSSVVDIPYPTVDYCGHDQNYTPSVRFTSQKAMVLRSNTTHVHGDAPGTLKGRKSGTVEGICTPVGHAAEVRAEGSCVIRHLDRFDMNNGNNPGEAIFVRDTRTYPAPEDDDPLRGSLKEEQAKPIRLAYDGADWAKFLQPQTGGGSTTTAPPSSAPSTSRVPTPPTPPVRSPSTLSRLGKFGRILGPLYFIVTGGGTPELDSLILARSAATKALEGITPQGAAEQALYDTAHARITPHVADAYNDPFTGVDEDYVRAERAYLEAKLEEERKSKKAVPQTDTVRIEQERERRRCRIDAYEKMEPICKNIGMQAHHIVPDWTLRWGTRQEAKDGLKRIDTMPGYWEGQSICVVGNARTSGTEHNEAHFADAAIENIGATSNPPYTATLDGVKRESIIAMTEVRPDCAEQIIKAVNDEFANSNKNQLLRARQRVQDITEGTMEILSNGKYKK